MGAEEEWCAYALNQILECFVHVVNVGDGYRQMSRYRGEVRYGVEVERSVESIVETSLEDLQVATLCDVGFLGRGVWVG